MKLWQRTVITLGLAGTILLGGMLIVGICAAAALGLRIMRGG